jgi:hypothetical protein
MELPEHQPNHGQADHRFTGEDALFPRNLAFSRLFVQQVNHFLTLSMGTNWLVFADYFSFFVNTNCCSKSSGIGWAFPELRPTAGFENGLVQYGGRITAQPSRR